MKLHELSSSEKIFLAEQLWESVRADADATPVSSAQKAELDARLASYELDKDAGEPWDQVKERILTA
jgi:putative addiction module component (TIGR02574 family)